MIHTNPKNCLFFLYLYPRLVERKVFLLIFSWPTLISFMKRICSRGKISPWFVPKTSCPWSHDQARNKPIPLLVSIPYMPPNIGLFVGFCGSTKIISTNLGWEGRFPGGAGVQAIDLLVLVWWQTTTCRCPANSDKHEGVGGLLSHLQSYSLLEPWQLVQKLGSWTRTMFWVCTRVYGSIILARET